MKAASSSATTVRDNEDVGAAAVAQGSSATATAAPPAKAAPSCATLFHEEEKAVAAVMALGGSLGRSANWYCSCSHWMVDFLGTFISIGEGGSVSLPSCCSSARLVICRPWCVLLCFLSLWLCTVYCVLCVDGCLLLVVVSH